VLLDMSVDISSYSAKKRGRHLEDWDSLEPSDNHKKFLCDGLTTLRLADSSRSAPTTKTNAGTPGAKSPSSDNSGISMDTEVVATEGADRRSQDDVCSENLLFEMKTGTRKYGRRVDYLVDELIRKSQRTRETAQQPNWELDLEDVIPNSIGPHPLTDRALGKLWPTVVPTEKGTAMIIHRDQKLLEDASEKQDPSNSDDNRMDDARSDTSSSSDDSDLGFCVNEHMFVPISTDFKVGCHPANSITHSDWGIEDVPP
jgi:hypothetical protein